MGDSGPRFNLPTRVRQVLVPCHPPVSGVQKRIQSGIHSLEAKEIDMEFIVQRSIPPLGARRGGNSAGSLSSLRKDT